MSMAKCLHNVLMYAYFRTTHLEHSNIGHLAFSRLANICLVTVTCQSTPRSPPRGLGRPHREGHSHRSGARGRPPPGLGRLCREGHCRHHRRGAREGGRGGGGGGKLFWLTIVNYQKIKRTRKCEKTSLGINRASI